MIPTSFSFDLTYGGGVVGAGSDLGWKLSKPGTRPCIIGSPKLGGFGGLGAC